jgi:hypothetical protein
MIPITWMLLSILPLNQLAEKIFERECGGKIEELTHWKRGEEFASLGIGHFIWYPSGKPDRFAETFPDLLDFIEGKGRVLPAFLQKSRTCPWNSRDEFYKNIESAEMISLRSLLCETKDLQADFIAKRLDRSISNIMIHIVESDRKKIQETVDRLSSTSAGLYALIDYLHFKGEGTSPSETYKGQGWGLLQVLCRLNPSSETLLLDFVREAKIVLSERVANAPAERHEQQWKKGWLNRLDGYIK